MSKANVLLKFVLFSVFVLVCSSVSFALVQECTGTVDGAPCVPQACASGVKDLGIINDFDGGTTKSFRICNGNPQSLDLILHPCEGPEDQPACSPGACPAGTTAHVYEEFHEGNKIRRLYAVCLSGQAQVKPCEGNCPQNCDSGFSEIALVPEDHSGSHREYRFCQGGTADCAIEAPAITSPAPDEVFTSDNSEVTLSWNPVAGASGYDVRVEYPGSTERDSRNSCGTHFVCIDNYNQNSIKVKVKPGVQYVWWLVARKPCGTGSQSLRQFKVSKGVKVTVSAMAHQGNGWPVMDVYYGSGSSRQKVKSFTVNNYLGLNQYSFESESISENSEIAVVYPNDYYLADTPKYVLQTVLSPDGASAWNRRCSYNPQAGHAFLADTCSNWRYIAVSSLALPAQVSSYDSVTYKKGADSYIGQSFISKDGTLVFERSCKLDPSFGHGFNPSMCTAYSTVNLNEMDTGLDASSRKYSVRDSFVFVGSDGKQVLVQSLIHQDGSRAWNRVCNENPNVQSGFVCERQWAAVNLLNEQMPSRLGPAISAADHKFSGFDTYVFENSVVQSFVSVNGVDGWNRECKLTADSKHGISDCSSWHFVSLAGEQFYGSAGERLQDVKMGSLDTFIFSGEGATDRNLVVTDVVIGSRSFKPASSSFFYDRGLSEQEFFDSLDVLSSREFMNWPGALRLNAPRIITVSAKADKGSGWPYMQLWLNGQFFKQWIVNSNEYASYSVDTQYSPGDEVAIIYPTDHTGLVSYVVKSYIDPDLMRIHAYRCPVRVENIHGFDPADCDAEDVSALPALKDENGGTLPNTFAGHSKYLTKDGAIIQTLIHSDNIHAWKRKCRLDPDSKYGPVMCGDFAPWNLISDQTLPLANVDKKFGAVDQFEFIDDNGMWRVVETLVHKDGHSAFNRVCSAENSDFNSGCSLWIPVDLANEALKSQAGTDLPSADKVFRGFDAHITQTSQGRSLILSLIHDDGVRGWNRVCAFDASNTHGYSSCSAWNFVALNANYSDNDNYVFTSSVSQDRNLYVNQVSVMGLVIPSSDPRVLYYRGTAGEVFESKDLVSSDERSRIGESKLPWSGGFRIAVCKKLNGVCCGDDPGEFLAEDTNCAQGCCGSNECYGISGCVSDGAYSSGNLCRSGKWVSLNWIIISSLGNGNIQCGPYKEILNDYNYVISGMNVSRFLGSCNGCIDNVCVHENAGKVTLAGTINDSSVLSSLLGNPAQQNLWHDRSTGIFVYSPSGVSALSLQPSAQGILEKYYVSSSSARSIVSSQISRCSSGKFEDLNITYKGFSANMCNVSDRLEAGKCSSNSIFVSKRDSVSSRIFDEWQSLTSKIKIEGK